MDCIVCATVQMEISNNKLHVNVHVINESDAWLWLFFDRQLLHLVVNTR